MPIGVSQSPAKPLWSSQGFMRPVGTSQSLHRGFLRPLNVGVLKKTSRGFAKAPPYRGFAKLCCMGALEGILYGVSWRPWGLHRCHLYGSFVRPQVTCPPLYRHFIKSLGWSSSVCCFMKPLGALQSYSVSAALWNTSHICREKTEMCVSVCLWSSYGLCEACFM